MKINLLVALLCVLTTLVACTSTPPPPPIQPKDLVFTRISENVYQYTAYQDTKEFGRVGANGLILVKSGNAFLIDTPWNGYMTRRIHDWIRDQDLSLAAAVITHWHNDRSAGLAYLESQEIPSYAFHQSNTALAKNNASQASFGFTETKLMLPFFNLELAHYGPGHTDDNIVVWLADHNILYGGCLVKSSDASSLGYVKDADLVKWPSTIHKIIAAYPDATLVVPGHGTGVGKQALHKTLDLLYAL